MVKNVYIQNGGGGGISSDDVTATLANVLSGKTALTSDSNDDIGTGTMPNNGSVSTSVAVGGSYTNTAGYYSSISISGPTLTGDAAAGNVLSGKKFYSNSGTRQTGTMANRGAVTATISSQNGTYTIPAGYHNGSGVITATLPVYNGSIS